MSINKVRKSHLYKPIFSRCIYLAFYSIHNQYFFNKDTPNQHVQYWIHDFCPETYSLFHLFSPFLLNLLRWYWLTKLYTVQVPNSKTHHLYTSLYGHHPKPSLCPSPFFALIPSYTSPAPPTTNHHIVVLDHDLFLFFFPFCSIPPPSPPPHSLTAVTFIQYMRSVSQVRNLEVTQGNFSFSYTLRSNKSLRPINSPS